MQKFVRRIPLRILAAAFVAAVGFAATAPAQDLAEFEKKVTEFTLDNGMTFIIVERHEAPVLSARTYANVGSVDEVKGITGIAHMFEHMAFKGTTTIGTKDWTKEKASLEKMDDLFDEIRAEQSRGHRADEAKLEKLWAEFKTIQEEASEFVNDEYEEVLQREGGSGLNASTWYDLTQYIVSLPSNKLELWMYLESQRWKDPVLREFYKERDVVMEERRMRTDNQPIGRLLEEFLATAYKAHPYGEPAVGHASDIQSYTRAEAVKFFETFYGPNNLTVCLAGDVDPKEAKKLAELYFDDIPARPEPPLVETVEPKQLGERRVTLYDPAQPVVIMGYHKPDMYHADDAVFDAVSDLMGNGRTSRLYTRMVKEDKIAIAAGGFAGLLGGKYPDLFVFFAIPSQGHTAEECEAAIQEEIDKLRDAPVTEAELAKARTRARAGLVRSMNSNNGLTGIMTSTKALKGDWRDAFYQLDRIDMVTAGDIQRVAGEYFTPTNRTVAISKPEEPAS